MISRIIILLLVLFSSSIVRGQESLIEVIDSPTYISIKEESKEIFTRYKMFNNYKVFENSDTFCISYIGVLDTGYPIYIFDFYLLTSDTLLPISKKILKTNKVCNEIEGCKIKLSIANGFIKVMSASKKNTIEYFINPNNLDNIEQSIIAFALNCD